MMITLLSCGAMAMTSAAALPVSKSLEELDFPAYLAHHGKSYAAGAEYDTRRSLFETRKRAVVAHNEAYRAGQQSWYMALNE